MSKKYAFEFTRIRRPWYKRLVSSVKYEWIIVDVHEVPTRDTGALSGTASFSEGKDSITVHLFKDGSKVIYSDKENGNN